MKLLLAIFKDFKLFFKSLLRRAWRRPWLTLFVITALLAAGIFLATTLGKPNESATTAQQLPSVSLITAGSYDPESANYNYSGQVAAVSEAKVTTESSGRITQVLVSRGQTVTASSVIARIENSSQVAALMQAEGALAAAQAAAAQSSISSLDANTTLTTARSNLTSSLNQVYATLSTINVNTINQFYTDTQTDSPNVILPNNYKLDGQLVYFLNSTKQNIDRSLKISNSNHNYEEAIQDIENVLSLINRFIQLSQDASAADRINGIPLSNYTVGLLAEQTTLNKLLSSLQASYDAVLTAENNLQKSKLAGDSDTVSVASAQVMQARGTLAAAQANLNKTILRAPISGVISSLDIQTGDFVSAFTPAATITNDETVQVTTYVTPSEAKLLAVGQSVMLADLATGTISSIGIALDPNTRKIPVIIYTNTSELTPGTTVAVKLESSSNNNTITDEILLPLTAIKTTATAAYAFYVEDDIITAQEVSLGNISNDSVIITAGLAAGDKVILDMRGRSAGEAVKVLSTN